MTDEARKEPARSANARLYALPLLAQREGRGAAEVEAR